jgi:glycosyltransferase involved in cell wall biosynthesis
VSRRWSGQWALPLPEEGQEPAQVDVLVPCYGRKAELAVTLAGLAGQEEPGFRVVLSDQTEQEPVWEDPAVAAMIRVLRCQGRPVRLERHLPRRGMAEQRNYLLSLATAPLVLYLDSDVWLEPDTLRRLAAALTEAGCGFVGAAVQGLSYLQDERPGEQEPFELWEGPVVPERMRRHGPGFLRWQLHNAANLTHLARKLDIPPGGWRLYKVAWVGGCVLFDRQALLDCGGFGFWDRLPLQHAGEDMAAQWKVMERFGGAGLVPSGAVHLESPTTIPDRPVEAADVVLDG